MSVIRDLLLSIGVSSCTEVSGIEYRDIREQGQRDVTSNGDFESDFEEWVQMKCSK